MTEMQQNMQEVVLEFQAKVAKLEQDNIALMNSPERTEKLNQMLLTENAELKNRMIMVTESNQDLEYQNRQLRNKLVENESFSAELESGIKMKLKQTEATVVGLEKQIETLITEISEKERHALDLEDKLKQLTKQCEIDKENLDDNERKLQVKLSSYEVGKAKEFSTLKRELALLTANKTEQSSIIEDLQKELSEIKENNHLELKLKDEELFELKNDLEDSLQNFETKKVELHSKLKGLEIAIQELEDENNRLKNERSRMIRDFNEDMSRISFQNRDMLEEIKFLKSQLGVDTSKNLNQDSIIRVDKKKEHKAHNTPSRMLQTPNDTDTSPPHDLTELHKKCRKYNKLIHKLREKIVLLQANSEQLQMEKDASTGFVSLETHSNVKKQLMDIQQKHKQFAAVFSQLEETEKIKEMKQDKIETIDQLKKSINELDHQSAEFLKIDLKDEDNDNELK